VRDQISARELKYWELLEKIDPWGQARDDYRAAKICQAFRGGNIADIMKEFDYSEPVPTDDQEDDRFYEAAKKKAKVKSKKSLAPDTAGGKSKKRKP